MTTKIFVNLAVKDIERTKDFFSKLGFSFNPQFSDEKAVSMIINDDSYVMMLREDFFSGFTEKQLTDAHHSTEVLMGISAESRDHVNEMVDKALRMGATEARPADDHGYMFTRNFSDLDGHIWEVIWMDMEGFVQAQK